MHTEGRGISDDYVLYICVSLTPAPFITRREDSNMEFWMEDFNSKSTKTRGGTPTWGAMSRHLHDGAPWSTVHNDWLRPAQSFFQFQLKMIVIKLILISFDVFICCHFSFEVLI